MQILGRHLTIIDEIDSTNNYAMRQLENGTARHGDAWLAMYQQHGKGQRGKSWRSEKGKNILLSILLNAHGVSLSSLFYLSAAMALAARNLFAKYVYDEKKVKLKWPNDIYWGDIKAGGLLIENKISGQNLQSSVVGFGLNINQETFDETYAKKAVSLKMIRGIDFDVQQLAAALCEEADKMYRLFEQQEYQLLLQQYNQHLYKRGETARLKKENIVFEAEIIGVNNQGRLMTRNGMLQEFDFGEISWEL